MYSVPGHRGINFSLKHTTAENSTGGFDNLAQVYIKKQVALDFKATFHEK